MISASAPPGFLPDGPYPGPQLREVVAALAAVGYDSGSLRGILATDGDIPMAPADLIIHERRLAAAPGPLADVIAVLALGQARPTNALRTALGGAALDALTGSGALVPDDRQARAAIRLLPHGDLWIAADRRPEPGTSGHALQVTGINPPATLLASLTVRRSATRALDLGTGNGIQALLAARHCNSVVATDVNPRALAFTEFNAALNGIDNVETRLGSLYDPVQGEKFDLVVSNPPYVISPENGLAYRDSGDEPGALCGRLVRELPEYLTDAGFGTVLASWPVSGNDWWDMPTGWLSPTGRAWLMVLRIEDTLLHARQWNAPIADGGDLAAFTTAVDDWTGYLRDRTITRIAYGAVVVQHHPDGPTLVRKDAARAGAGSASAHIQRVFANQDTLAGVADDSALTDWSSRVADGYRLDRSMHLADGSWQPGTATFGLTEGVSVEATLDPLMTDILLRVTAGATIGAAAAEIGSTAGVPADEMASLVAAACAMMRELIGLGLVLPVVPTDVRATH